jgi:ubiquinone/menaquinone biosynthesis C-methylase UbiE
MIANYDKYDYDYSNYWENREYEHLAEINVLKKLLKGKGNFFLDIGGSFGRHAPLYADRYKTPIILDYSLKTLQKNREDIQKRFANVEMIAANAYKLPFRESSIDSAMMIRVLHHIDRPEEYLTELKRVLGNDSEYIQEFANKYHIKARIRAFIKGDTSFFSTEPYQQPTAENFEGTEGEEAIFLNYHPRFLRELLERIGFEVVAKRGSSYLRIPLLKKLLPESVLLFFEKTCQILFSWSNLPPSVFFKATLKKDSTEKYSSLGEILVCPSCKSELRNEKGRLVCVSCKKSFEKKDGIWDFRVDD